MRIANLNGRLVLLRGQRAVDVATASSGTFDSDPQGIYDRWDEFCVWERDLSDDDTRGQQYDPGELGPPVPRPRQIFAIGLNYQDHAAESEMALPAEPAVFTKFVTALTGPFAEVPLPTASVDWEVELVVVIGKAAYGVTSAEAWDHVAGVTIGQDISERTRQLVPPVPQFSIGKSFPGFAPTGPAVVTTDELGTRDDLELGCRLNDKVVQRGRTADLIFTVPELIARMSAILMLLPGDLIFTGTPSGVGHARRPPMYLKPGDALTSWIEGLGEMRTTFVPSPAAVVSAR